MRLLYGALILFINIAAAITGYSNIAIAAVQLGIILLYFRHSKKDGFSNLVVMLELMCYTWASSGRSILGGSFAQIPVPWFYLIGLAVVIDAVVHRRFRLSSYDVVMYYSLVAIPLIALLISQSKAEAITEYITLIFTFGVGLAMQCSVKKVTFEEYQHVLDAYVNSIVLVAVGITMQYFIQTVFGINIIKNTESVLIGGYRLANSLLFLDLSSATIFCYLAALVILWNWEKTRYSLVKITVIVVGISLSSARTGLLALSAGYSLYILLGNRTITKKIIMVLSGGIAVAIIMATLNQVRNLNHLSESFDNGRIVGYLTALRILKGHLLLGIGFGDKYLSSLMEMPIPHFTILKILVQMGIVFTIPLMFYLIQIFLIADRKYIGKYLFFGALVGSCVIPGLFSARFIVIIIGIIYLENSMLKIQKKEKTNRKYN